MLVWFKLCGLVRHDRKKRQEVLQRQRNWDVSIFHFYFFIFSFLLSCFQWKIIIKNWLQDLYLGKFMDLWGCCFSPPFSEKREKLSEMRTFTAFLFSLSPIQGNGEHLLAPTHGHPHLAIAFPLDQPAVELLNKQLSIQNLKSCLEDVTCMRRNSLSTAILTLSCRYV